MKQECAVATGQQAEMSPAFLDSFGFDIKESKFPSGTEVLGPDGCVEGRKSLELAGWSGNIIRVNF